MTKCITITQEDRRRLGTMLQTIREHNLERSETLHALESELELARALDPTDVPPDLVTMDSTVEVRDLDTGEVDSYTLVFPEQADIGANRISVVAPVGTALLGCCVGDVVRVAVPSGKRRLRIDAIHFQPESSFERLESTLRGP